MLCGLVGVETELFDRFDRPNKWLYWCLLEIPILESGNRTHTMPGLNCDSLYSMYFTTHEAPFVNPSVTSRFTDMSYSISTAITKFVLNCPVDAGFSGKF